MGPNERAEWEEARELVKNLQKLMHEMGAREWVLVGKEYWSNLW